MSSGDKTAGQKVDETLSKAQGATRSATSGGDDNTLIGQASNLVKDTMEYAKEQTGMSKEQTQSVGGLVDQAKGLATDAIDSARSYVGQGAGQAFEDAVVLGAALGGGGGLARYDALRAPRVAAMQRATRNAHRVLTLRGARAHARDLLMRAVPAPLATRALVTQLHFNPERAGAALASPR